MGGMLTLMPLASADSKHVHTFHQSWLQTFMTCPEQGRLIYRKELPRDATDASARGHAVHAGIEAVLNDCVQPDEALSIAFKAFREEAKLPAFRYVKHKRESTVLGHIEGSFASWWDYVYPTLGAAMWIEKRFKFPFYEDDERVIYLSGTADYAERGRIDDWKTTTNKDKYSESFGGDGWEQKRWSIQASAYCAAYFDQYGYLPTFRFVALDVQGREPQLLEVERSGGQILFFREQCVTVAQQLERGNDHRYVINDQHALCSPRWCLNWANCKGKYLG